MKLQFLLKNNNFPIVLKTIAPYIIVFLFTIAWNTLLKKNKTKCLGVGTDLIEDECTPHAGQLWGSLITTFIVIQTYSSGHFLFGSTLISKYAILDRKKILLFLNFCTFMFSHCIVLNGPIFEEKVCIVFKIVFIVILNAFSFITISRFIGHKKPFALMKNYFYFELLTCSIPTVTVLASKATYPIFIKAGSVSVALFLTSIFNSICDYMFSKLMILTILGENEFVETIDLMPGSFILTGYFDGLFFGNLFPQDIGTFSFWINVIVYYGINLAIISGLKRKILEYYAPKNKKQLKRMNILILIQNGSRFYSIFPLILTVVFAHLNTPYFYGSQLYDYRTFDWLETTEKYNNETIPSIFSFQKLSVMIGFSLVLFILGYFFRKNYVFCEITLLFFLKIFFILLKYVQCSLWDLNFLCK